MPSIQRLPSIGHEGLQLQPIGYSFPDCVIAGDPKEAAQIFWDRSIGTATIGIWTSNAGTVRFPAYPFYELCIIVEGAVTLKGIDGTQERFAAGDLFIVPKDWAGDWIMEEPLSKFYVELKA